MTLIKQIQIYLNYPHPTMYSNPINSLCNKFIEFLLHASHCAKCWPSRDEELDKIPTFMELSLTSSG